MWRWTGRRQKSNGRENRPTPGRLFSKHPVFHFAPMFHFAPTYYTRLKICPCLHHCGWTPFYLMYDPKCSTTFPWCTINAPAAFAWCTINAPAVFAWCTNQFVHKVEFSYIWWNGVHTLCSLSPPALRSQNAGRKTKCYCIIAPYCRQSKDLLMLCWWNFHRADNKRRLVQTVLCLWNYVRGQANYVPSVT